MTLYISTYIDKIANKQHIMHLLNDYQLKIKSNY